MRIEQSRMIAAPARQVWSLITEPKNIVQWHPRAQRIDFIGEKHGGVGILFYMESRADGNKLMRSVCEITEWQEDKIFTFHEVLGTTKKFEARLVIEDHGDNCSVSIIGDCVLPYWIIGRIMLLLLRQQWIQMMEDMIMNIKLMAETQKT